MSGKSRTNGFWRFNIGKTFSSKPFKSVPINIDIEIGGGGHIIIGDVLIRGRAAAVEKKKRNNRIKNAIWRLESVHDAYRAAGSDPDPKSGGRDGGARFT